jgi:hypothetical protein
MQTHFGVLGLARIRHGAVLVDGDLSIADGSASTVVLAEPPAQAEFVERALIEVADGPRESLECLWESGRCGPCLCLVVHSEAGSEIAELG